MYRNKVLISTNASWNIVNFRRGLVAALQANGYQVTALAPEDEHSLQLPALGVEYHPIEIDKQGMSPARDLKLFLDYYRLLRRIRPDVFLGYTAKPNIYGSLAAHALGIPVINNVAGLGTAFIKQGLLTRVVSSLYRLAFSRSATVFFQNADDKELFIRKQIVRGGQTGLLPGSGINLKAFSPRSNGRSEQRDFVFLLVGRLLWDKGLSEYVEAARQVRAIEPSARFQILGFLDVPNRTAVTRADVDGWVEEGAIEYLGHSQDVRPAIAAADCIVLPSYREGLPRTLLEGAAMAKPLIASDVPGCRHVVEHGRNGFLCTVRDSASLADTMLKMLRLPSQDRAVMGAAGRARIEAEFDERIPAQSYLRAIAAALSR